MAVLDVASRAKLVTLAKPVSTFETTPRTALLAIPCDDDDDVDGPKPGVDEGDGTTLGDDDGGGGFMTTIGGDCSGLPIGTATMGASDGDEVRSISGNFMPYSA